MSLEDKALMLTQYPIDSICGNKEIVTGCWDMDGMTNDMIMRVGTVLNVANGETADRIRAIRKENGIDDPLMFMLDVIHGYRTIFLFRLPWRAVSTRNLWRSARALPRSRRRRTAWTRRFRPW